VRDRGRGATCTGLWWWKETAWETGVDEEDNIKMDVQEVGSWSMDWIELAQNSDRGGLL